MCQDCLHRAGCFLFALTLLHLAASIAPDNEHVIKAGGASCPGTPQLWQQLHPFALQALWALCVYLLLMHRPRIPLLLTQLDSRFVSPTRSLNESNTQATHVDTLMSGEGGGIGEHQHAGSQIGCCCLAYEMTYRCSQLAERKVLERRRHLSHKMYAGTQQIAKELAGDCMLERIQAENVNFTWQHVQVSSSYEKRRALLCKMYTTLYQIPLRNAAMCREKLQPANSGGRVSSGDEERSSSAGFNMRITSNEGTGFPQVKAGAKL